MGGINLSGEKLRMAKLIVKLVAGGLVDLFAGAVISNVLDDCDVGKVPKIGAYIGGGLIGVMVGDKVGDYLCDEIDEFADDFDEIKTAIEED